MVERCHSLTVEIKITPIVSVCTFLPIILSKLFQNDETLNQE